MVYHLEWKKNIIIGVSIIQTRTHTCTTHKHICYSRRLLFNNNVHVYVDSCTTCVQLLWYSCIHEAITDNRFHNDTDLARSLCSPVLLSNIKPPVKMLFDVSAHKRSISSMSCTYGVSDALNCSTLLEEFSENSSSNRSKSSKSKEVDGFTNP